jgi:hypothetical protein
MNGLEEQADNAKAREIFWKPLSWLCTIRPTSANINLNVQVCSIVTAPMHAPSHTSLLLPNDNGDPFYGIVY